jgi:hypothetical protein
VEFDEAKRLLDEINSALSEFDPVLKEKARDILLATAFGTCQENGNPSEHDEDRRELRPNGEVRTPSFNRLIKLWPPKTQAESTLLCAYYFQEVLGFQTVTGNKITRTLKKHDLAMTNVTRAAMNNIEATPPRMKKVGKIGNTDRSHSAYALTSAGLEYAQNKLLGLD